MERIRINQVVIVEGKYDKIKLESVIDADIITTEGFKVFTDKEKLALIRKMGMQRGIIIFTDPDRAGSRIRSHIRGAVPPDRVTDIYIPGIAGREPRKSKPSAEGFLGVEGVDADVVRRVFDKFRAAKAAVHGGVTKRDFYSDGLSGGENSAKLRELLCARLELPHMAANALLSAVNMLTDQAGYREIIHEIKQVALRNNEMRF